MIDRIEFDSEEIEAASHWHGGQSSMLYAVASTGELRRGTRCPSPEMTDAEWFADLASRLENEADECAELAGDDPEAYDDIEPLRSIANKARQAYTEHSESTP